MPTNFQQSCDLFNVDGFKLYVFPLLLFSEMDGVASLVSQSHSWFVFYVNCDAYR